jgi:hypothetical protein
MAALVHTIRVVIAHKLSFISDGIITTVLHSGFFGLFIAKTEISDEVTPYCFTGVNSLQ